MAQRGCGPLKRVLGAYIILLELEKDKEVTVGRLGTFGFPGGWYAYTGSAMGGLEARVQRHLSSIKRAHWHIDHLLCEAGEREALLLPSHRDVECELNEVVTSLHGSSIVARGFGSSDCACEAHLHHLTVDAAQCLRRCFPAEWVRKRLPIDYQ